MPTPTTSSPHRFSVAAKGHRYGSNPGQAYNLWQPTTREHEKRLSPRRSLACQLTLTHATTCKQVPAECDNFGQGGLYAVVAIGHGVAIGQCYSFELHITERGPEPGTDQAVTQQGEIVRVELLVGENGYADRIGIGVRLFGLRTGMVPMPNAI